MSVIKSHSVIYKDLYVVDGEEFEIPAGEKHFTTRLYKHLGIDYSKIYKMDMLAKTSFLGVELLNSKVDFSQYGDEEIGQVFGNSESSLFSDRLFEESYKVNESPSPAHFVYTLPNILMGEMAIRNKWYGDTILFVSKEFDEVNFAEQIFIQQKNGAKASVVGWVNVTGEQPDAQFWFIELNENSTVEDIQNELRKDYEQFKRRA